MTDATEARRRSGFGEDEEEFMDSWTQKFQL
jgi:hypothetical protein